MLYGVGVQVPPGAPKTRYGMYTVEFDHDKVAITIIDDSGKHSDLQVNSHDNIVYIKQYNPNTDSEVWISISPEMWEELITAIDSPEGAFRHVR